MNNGWEGTDQDPLPKDKLERLSVLAHRQVDYELQVAQMEEALKHAKALLREVSERDIPQLMDELGVDSITVQDQTITVEDKWSFSVAKDRMSAACDWFEGHDLGGSVKRTVSAAFPVEQAQEAFEAEALLKKNGYHPVMERTVHHSTRDSLLKAIIKEEGAEAVPQELFAAQFIRRSIVKSKKGA